MKRILVAALLAAASGAANAETIDITIGAGSPPVIPPIIALKEHFIPEVERRLKEVAPETTIKWNEAYGGTLVNLTSTMEGVQDGIVDMGLFFYQFEEANLPLHQVTFMAPFGTRDPQKLVEIVEALYEKVPAFNDTWTQFNQVHIASGPSSSWELFTTFPVTKFEDLQGKRIGASGVAANYLLGTGAVVIDSVMPEGYNSMSTGLYQGYPATIGLAYPYKLYQVAKYGTKTGFGAVLNGALTINKDKWDSLPPAVQQVFLEAGKSWSRAYAKIEEDRVTSFADKMTSEGTEISELSPEERKRWAEVLPDIAKTWADGLDGRGLPGTQVLKTYMDELRARENDLPRQWDK